MAVFTLVTAWDITPTSASTYEIYEPDDQYLIGNSVDAIKKYDLVDFTDLEGGAPKGNIFEVYKFRLMVAGDLLFPHRIWFSHIGSAEGWSKDTDWIDIYPNDGGKINGFEIQNDELIISKDNGRKYGWRIYDDGDPQNSKVRIIDDSHGNITRRAATVMSDIDYFMDHEGLFDIPKTTLGGLTFIVDEFVKGIQDPSLITVGSHDGRVYISAGDVHLDLGDTVVLNDATLVLDVVNQSFYVRDNIDARIWTRFNDGVSLEELYFGNSTGRVFKINDGLLAGEEPIHMRIRTKKYFEELGRNVSVSSVCIFMDDPDGTLVTYRTSNTKDRKTLGTVTQETQWFDVKDAKGPFIELEFTHSNTTSRPELLGYSFIYKVEGMKGEET